MSLPLICKWKKFDRKLLQWNLFEENTYNMRESEHWQKKEALGHCRAMIRINSWSAWDMQCQKRANLWPWELLGSQRGLEVGQHRAHKYDLTNCVKHTVWELLGQKGNNFIRCIFLSTCIRKPAIFFIDATSAGSICRSPCQRGGVLTLTP